MVSSTHPLNSFTSNMGTWVVAFPRCIACYKVVKRRHNFVEAFCTLYGSSLEKIEIMEYSSTVGH